ncbi:unnamed protein product [Cylindrotheca closterium]|uniref:START domain-containing protein n=1 Tax=Cylindrotheca closterium TaxID=2856 RepID=A0AAD2CBV4_9STRA|nr:unnamed protein product [Cylindrotheca closterium]
MIAARKSDLPHPHNGILSPYKPGPFFALRLDNADQQALASGKPVLKQSQSTGEGAAAGGAICVQDIRAPKDQVWEQILGLNAYKGKVPKVNECTNYCDITNKDGTRNIKTKMVVGVIPGYSFTSYYDHIYLPKYDSMIWVLDYGKTSDFDDVSGHWHLEEHPKDPNWTRVFYACDIRLKGTVPKPVMNYLSQSALRTATGWVKKESEKSSSRAEQTSETDIESPSPTSGEEPKALQLSGADIRALLLGRTIKKKHTLSLSKQDMKTLSSKQFLSTQEAAFSTKLDQSPRATIEMAQSLEPPKISLLARCFLVFCLGILSLDIVFAILALLKWEL